MTKMSKKIVNQILLHMNMIKVQKIQVRTFEIKDLMVRFSKKIIELRLFMELQMIHHLI